jgi:mRNA-degrading endonuclease YafQ of YafQ-DinJ toxin-antitoxin module
MLEIFYKSQFNQDLTSWKDKIKDKKQLKYIEDYIR